MSAPGVANSALTVGAVDSNDQLADFSSTGPRFGDYALKPDISAPGVDILAAKAGGTAATGYYVSESGTSMATPHVAGAAAILAQEHPDWDGQRIKDELMSSSNALPDYTDYQVGNGRVDIANAITDPITATGSTYFGSTPGRTRTRRPSTGPSLTPTAVRQPSPSTSPSRRASQGAPMTSTPRPTRGRRRPQRCSACRPQPSPFRRRAA